MSHPPNLLAMDEYHVRYERGDFLIRNLVGGDRETGELVAGVYPRVGQTVQFQVRDPMAADGELGLLLDRAGGALRGQPRADEIAAVASGIHSRWLATGVEAPAVFTEAGRTVAPAGSLVVQVSGIAPDDVIRALAEGLTPPQPDCVDSTTGVTMGTTGGIATIWLQAWYAATGGH